MRIQAALSSRFSFKPVSCHINRKASVPLGSLSRGLDEGFEPGPRWTRTQRVPCPAPGTLLCTPLCCAQEGSQHPDLCTALCFYLRPFGIGRSQQAKIRHTEMLVLFLLSFPPTPSHITQGASNTKQWGQRRNMKR